MTILHQVDYSRSQNINTATKAVYDASNFFLTPARYLFGGRTVICYVIPVYHNKKRGWMHCFKDSTQRNSNMFKTAIAIIAFIPSFIIGISLKTLVFIFSKNLRHGELNFGVYLFESKFYQITDEIKIGIHFQSEEIILNALKVIDETEKARFKDYYDQLGTEGGAYIIYGENMQFNVVSLNIEQDSLSATIEKKSLLEST